MNDDADGAIEVPVQETIQLLNWITRLGESVLDHLFMEHLPVPFLVGHSLGLALSYAPPKMVLRVPLLRHTHNRVVELWDSFSAELQPPSMRIADSTDAAVERFLSQVKRVGWAVCGFFFLPALLRRVLGQPSLEVLPAMAGRPALILSTGTVAVWAATGMQGLMHGLWSSHQVINTLVEYQNNHPANILPFLFPEHVDIRERAWGLVQGGIEWLGLASPSQRRRQQKLKVFMVRLILTLSGSVIYFALISRRSPKGSIPNIWAKSLGILYFTWLCLPSLVNELVRL